LNTRQKGAQKEGVAAEFLEAQGMRLVERNFRNRQGEIDLIGYHEGYLVFVEVKYRRNLNRGSAVEAVGVRKQQQICKVADYYRYTHRIHSETAIRYDVVAIQGEEIHWIKDAFRHLGSF